MLSKLYQIIPRVNNYINISAVKVALKFKWPLNCRIMYCFTFQARIFGHAT